MALGGEIFTAEEARLLGIVDVVVPTGNALAAAREYAQRIAARGPAATEIAKLMIASANGEDNGTAVEALGSILAAKTGDLKEGVASFSEKRPATFKGEW
nr:2,3-dehydroadipyl-CoA hydratase [Bacillus subtilis]